MFYIALVHLAAHKQLSEVILNLSRGRGARESSVYWRDLQLVVTCPVEPHPRTNPDKP